MMRILIDPGHGASDPGACGNGIIERDFNLQGSQVAKVYLETNYDCEVTLTRNDNVSRMPINAVASLAKGFDALVAIHVNAGGGSGGEIFIRDADFVNRNASRIVAQKMLDYYIEHTGLRNRGVKSEKSTSVGSLGVFRQNNPISLLFEYAFLDDKTGRDIPELKNGVRLMGVFAEAIAVGLGLAKKTPKEDIPPVEEGNPGNSINNEIVDLPSTWAAEAWKWAVDLKITDGTRPRDVLTRQEAIQLIFNIETKLRG